MASHTHSGQVVRCSGSMLWRPGVDGAGPRTRSCGLSQRASTVRGWYRRRRAGTGFRPACCTRGGGRFGPIGLGSEDLAHGFVPAMIIPETRPDSGACPTGRMEIVVAKGRRIIVDAGVDAAALARVIAILDRR